MNEAILSAAAATGTTNVRREGGSPGSRVRLPADTLGMAAMRNVATLFASPLHADVFLDAAAEGGDDCGLAEQQGSKTSLTTTTTTPFVRTLPAHRALLAAASPTFHAMFESGMLEAQRGAHVAVPYSFDVMECILAFIYCRPNDCKQRLHGDTAFDVLDAACYFVLDPLKEAAVEFIIELATDESILTILSAALKYQSHRLRDFAVGYIRQHNTDVLGSPLWTTLPKEAALLLVRETVIESDLDLLRSCLEWCRRNAAPDPIVPVAPDAADETKAEPEIDSVALSGPPPVTANHAALMQEFIQYINFTAMTMEEIEEVERMQCVPIEVLYRAFKSHALGGPPAWTARQGGILLQWETPVTKDLLVDNNRAIKSNHGSFDARTITAMNRFAAGRHYWYFMVHELRTKHDALVGVRMKRGGASSVMVGSAAASPPMASTYHDPNTEMNVSNSEQPSPNGGRTAAATESRSERGGGVQHVPDYDVEILYEPCCNTITAIPSSALRVTRADSCPGDAILGPDYSAVVGVAVDFNDASVRFYNHRTKALLFTVEAVAPATVTGGNDAPVSAGVESRSEVTTPTTPRRSSQPEPPSPPAPLVRVALPGPLYPCATLYHRSNGGVTLSDTTTYLGERVQLARSHSTLGMNDSVASGGSTGAGGGGDSLAGTPSRRPPSRSTAGLSSPSLVAQQHSPIPRAHVPSSTSPGGPSTAGLLPGPSVRPSTSRTTSAAPSP